MAFKIPIPKRQNRILFTAHASIFLLTILAGFLPFYKVLLFPDSALLYRDLSLVMIPSKMLWLQNILKYGSIPLWDHYSLAGVPLLADCNAAMLYPLNLIFLFFSPQNLVWGFSFFIASHYCFIFLGYYLFFRRTFSIHKFISLISALTLCWGGFALSCINLPHLLSGQLSTPWFLFCWLFFLKKKNNFLLFAASFFLILPILGGDPQYSLILGFIAIITQLKNKNHSWNDKAKNILSLFTLAFLASAIQLLPTLDFLQNTVRASNAINSQENLHWSLHPMRLIEMFVPLFFGNLVPERTYWADAYINAPVPLPFIFSLYLGSVSLFSILSYGFYFKPSRKNKVVVQASITIAALLLTFGYYSPIPIYSFLGKIIPFWNGFRYPERLSFSFLLLLTIFSAKQLQRLSLLTAIVDVKKTSTLKKKFICLLIVMLFLLFCIFLLQISFPIPAESIIHSASLFSLVLLVFGAYIWKKIPSEKFLFLLLLLSFFDLFLFSQKLIWEQPASITKAQSYPLTNEIISDLKIRQKDIDHGAARRFYSLNEFLLSWDEQKTQGILDYVGTLCLHAWEALAGNIPAFFGIETVTGYHTLMPKTQLSFWQSLKQNPIQLFSVLGVYYIEIRNKNVPPHLRINKNALPYVFVANEQILTTSSAEALQFLQSPQNLPKLKHAVILDSPPTLHNPKPHPASAAVQIIRRNGRDFDVKIHLKEPLAPAWLVWNERYNKHWKASIQQQKIPIMQANLWAMAIALPSDTSQQTYMVHFSYEDPAIYWGSLLSGLWIALGVLGMLLSIYRGHSPAISTQKR